MLKSKLSSQPSLAWVGDGLFFSFFALYWGAAAVWLVVGVSPLILQVAPGLRSLIIDWGNEAITNPNSGVAFIGRLMSNSVAYSFSLRPQALLQSLFSLLNMILAVVVIRLRPANLAARCLAIAMIGTGAVFNLQAHIVERVWPGLYGLHDYFHYISGAAYIYALVLFPDGRATPYRISSKRSAWLWLVYFVFLPLLGLLFGFITDGEPEGLVAFFGVIIPIAGMAAQLYRYRHASTESERQPSRVILWALVMAFGLALLFAPLALWFGSNEGQLIPAATPLDLFIRHWWDLKGLVFTIFPLLFAIIPLSLSVAILRYRLWDIDLLLNRTMVYGMLSAIVIGLYIVVVGALSALFQSNGNLAFSLLATGLVAVLFQPLRDWLQRAVNRFVYGDRDDPYAVLGRLGHRLEATLAPETVLPIIVQTVKEAFKLPYVALELTTEDTPATTDYEKRNPKYKLLRLPLTYQGVTLGVLLVAPRGPDDPFSPADRRLLENITRQAGVAVHAVQLTQDLRHARERLIVAREEERRRLRRDLHDGLGPTLATLAFQADAAREAVAMDSTQAEAILTDVTGLAQGAIADIRRLVYDLRPPALDDLGLVGAIQALMTRFETSGVNFAVDAPEPLPSLPAAVEVAAYRIAQEAITNVVRHAQARQCRVRLWVADEAVAPVDPTRPTLWLDVSDDGQGMTADRHTGVGLTSMRERAEELGGSCVIEADPTGGVRVRALLPLLLRVG